MSQPVVSVVIPTYNQPALLAETLGTVFAQTFQDFEVVIVDDGSTDDGRTAAYLASLTDPRVRVIRQDNKGIGAARNRGIDEARGQYVALLDHDDLWMPEKLAAQVRFMREHPQCASCTVPWAQSTTPHQCFFDVTTVRSLDGIVDRPLRHLAKGIMLLITSSILFDRERARGLRYETQRQCIEDVPFQIGLLARGAFGIAGGDEILMVYRVHSANYSSQAAFYYHGVRLLRELDRHGHFDAYRGSARSDLRAFLAHIGRAAAVRQLVGGYRWRGLRTYVTECPYQLADMRGRFLTVFPLLLLTPGSIIRRRWRGRTT